jgi:cold-inducible RNA-binding protein
MKLYIGNLPYQVAESDLQDWFTQAGVTVDSISLVRDRFSGEPRGFGFVEIQNNEAAESAIRACNGKQLMGRAVVVNEARPQPPHGGGGGGGGGRPRSGGGGGGGGRGGSRRPPRW